MNRPPSSAGQKRTSPSSIPPLGPALLLCLGLLIVGCGNRGALYLPDATEPAAPPLTTTTDPDTPFNETSDSAEAESGAIGNLRSDEEEDDEDDLSGPSDG